MGAAFPAADLLVGPRELAAADVEWRCCAWVSRDALGSLQDGLARLPAASLLRHSPTAAPAQLHSNGARLPRALPGAGGHGELALPRHAASKAGRNILRQRIIPLIKTSYLCSFPCALNFACVSGKRAVTSGQSTASSQRRESAFNFSSDFPSLFSLIPPAITE